ncbi:MAG: hypothetical protein A3H35_06410 [Betaproteobacteria bacterium RIFCSPLOWO2_02_FULL_62_17]|nr:MAG: hypothetical protein A3H35_06410 [Betaproteobacteria bacterium RIFCSPLOWO2_02_FULL_62_17]
MSEERPSGGLLRSKAGIALFVFGAIAAFFLITEHQAHLWGWLPYLLVLACPLMHIFMHGGHGSHGQQHGARRDDTPPGDPDADKARRHERGPGDTP